MTSAVLYGTTSDNELRPVRVTDSGEFVTDGGGGGDWYANLYIGGTEGDPSISLLSSGDATFKGSITANEISSATGSIQAGGLPYEREIGAEMQSGGVINACREGTNAIWYGYQEDNPTATSVITAAGDVYGRKFIDADGYDVSKIGQALSTIHDVIESVDDLQGLKNLFHLLLDNLKSDPTPPEPPEPSE